MKNIVLIPEEAALDRVISALSVVPQLVPNTKRGWFGGKAQSKHLRTIMAGGTRLDLYQARPHASITIKGNVIAAFTYLEIHKDLINWGAVYAQLNGDNVTRTGQKFRVKLPSGYYVVVEPLAKYRAGASLHSRDDARMKMQKKFERDQLRQSRLNVGTTGSVEGIGNTKFSAGEMQRIAHDIEAQREETFTEVAEEVTDAQELAIAEQAMAEKQDTVVIDSMSQLAEQERTMEGEVENKNAGGTLEFVSDYYGRGLSKAELAEMKARAVDAGENPVVKVLRECIPADPLYTADDLTPTPHAIEESTRPVGGLGTCPCDDSAFGDQE